MDRRTPLGATLANSFPKSGTHLLVQVLEAFPGIRNFDSFIASVPPIRFRERRPAVIRRRLELVAPRELVSAHLFFEPAVNDQVARRGIVHYFIFRDPRDVAVSEAFYLTYMNRWHRLHRFFRALPSDEARIWTAIVGIPATAAPYEYPDIGKRFDRYAGWLTRPEVCLVRYEELMSDQREAVIRRMAERYATCVPIDVEAAVAASVGMIQPAKSRTFRVGGTGGWRRHFTNGHLEAMKTVAGKLLVALGYEPDTNWS
jgi:hypothetical protein